MRTTAVPRTAINRLSLFSPLLALTLGASVAQADLSSWPYAMKIDVSGYNRTETLTNFPVLVVLSNNLAGFTYSTMNSPSNGTDLRFSVDTLNEINYEIDQWDTNGVSTVWVQVPDFASNASVYAHWGYAASQPAYTTNGATWSNNYVAVWHLGEQVTAGGTTGSHYDSTTNANTGAQSKNGWTNGLIGRAQNFDRTATINCGNKASLRPTNITISAWIHPRNISYTTYVEIYRKEDGGNRHLLSFQSSGALLSFGIAPGGTYGETDINISAADYTGAWHHVAATYNGAVRKVYRDGVEISTVNASGALTTSGTANGYIGTFGGNSEYFDGLIDQLEISGVGRSSNWVWASYMQVASNQPFFAYNTYTVGGPHAPIIANRDPTNVTTTSAWLNGYLSSTGTAPTTVAVYWGTQDGGAPTSGLWQATNIWSEGAWAAGSYPTFQATPLTSDTFYYYRYAAWNSVGTNGSASTANFLAGNVSATAPDPAASESGDTGTFRISRAATATNESTVVSYSFVGSAVLNTDYTLTPAGTSLTLAPGVASADITVTPRWDRPNTNDTVVTLQILPGGLYAVGASSNASITITNQTPPPTNYVSILANGQSKNWSDATAWSPYFGPPGTLDTVTITNQIPWSGGWSLALDAGWAADTLTLSNTTAGINNHDFGVGNGKVRILNVNLNSGSGNGYHWIQNSGKRVTMSEFNNLGTILGYFQFGTSGDVWDFTGAAQITYFTGKANIMPEQVVFTNATSVTLKRSTTTPNAAIYGATNMEVLANTDANGGFAWCIGRADNSVQNWTVSGGSHPVLQVNPSQGAAMLAKIGNGDVNMPGVDLYLNANRNGGISSSGLGDHGGGTAGGVISANSLTVAGGGATLVGIVEHLKLSGQAGLDGGGAGNGRAFSAVTSNQNLKVQINNYGSVGTLNVGQIEIAQGGGEVYLNSLGTGTVHLNIGNNNVTTHTYTNSVAVTADTLNLATTNSYLSDRCLYSDTDALASGNLEFRGNFICRSTLTNLWRTDHTTVRAIGGGTNALQYWECMSKDNGTNAPGIANFALARLILGQSATGAVAQAKLALRDQYDNNTVDATPEVLYVSNLLMYAHSTLYLDGLKLLYFNGSAWTQAVAGVFAGGDGTGSIGASSLVSLANIGNGAATNVTVSTATLTGTLWDEGSGQTLVSVFWGLTNGTTNAAAWAHTNTFTGYQTTGAALSTNIVLDTPNRFYYYRFYATNSSGEAWAPVSSFFQAAPITIVATTPEASEENTVPGVFTVTRAGSLTNEAVTVNYTVSGTAGNGVDYTTLSGAVPLGAGQASATIVVTPIMDATNEPDETAIVTLTAGAYALGSPSNATVTIHNNSNLVWYCALTNGQTGNWSASATWTNVGGLIGVPTLSDTAVINDLPSGSFTLGLDPGWGAKNLFLNSASAVQHFLSLASDGYVKSLTWNSSSPAGYVGLFWEGGGYKVTVDQFRNVGPNVPNGRWIGGSGAYLFTNAAQIVYHTTNATDLACLADFGGASSVHLARSTALGTTTMETLGAQSANAQPPTYIGRRDNGVQTWTVGAGNHPLLRAQNAYGYSLAKVGTNHVDMSDVDLWCVCAANVSYGISSSGAAAGAGTALYQGEIRANSLTFTRTESATVYTQSFDIVGALVLDGQGGLQAGGTGNGRAFSLVSNTNGQTRLRFGSHSSPGNAGLAKRAQVSITPAGGEFYLNGAAPAGSIKWEIYNTAAERTNATLIANTINLASPRAVINDRDPQNDTDANAGGTLEFRGDFVSQCTDTNNFRMEFSTVRTIGGLTNEVQYWECMSQDLGAVPAGFTNNFALGRLVLGQTSAGATAKADLVLRNQSDNNLADALAEAVYVTNLTMYANSCLYLNGFNLYYKNGGSWQRAVPGAFAPGDGTGRIREIWPVPSGTTFKFR